MRGPFSQRTFFLLAVDALLINAACYCAMLLRFDGQIPPEYLLALLRMSPLITGVSLGFLSAFKLYGRVWKYASLDELVSLTKATTCSIIFIIICTEAFQLPRLPGSVYFAAWGLIIFFIGASRLWWRLFRELFPGEKHKGIRVLIVGAGDAGARIVREIRSNPAMGMEAVAFVDDDPLKQGKRMLGLSIRGSSNDIPELVATLEVEEIIIAMPSIKGPAIRGIINICEETSAHVKILPNLYQSSLGSILSQVRRVNMEDLLGRYPVQIDLQQVCGYIAGKTVLITGGGGSIGSELCRQIVKFNPRQLIILDNSESNLFDIEMELKDAGWGTNLAVELLDVKNRDHLETIFIKYHPQVVFHAAAYKHVPMMERHPEAALSNNVVGTHHIAELADKYGCETFILISTDKAVNPTSVMGATKRLGELIIKEVNRNSNTRYAAVRFGNVLGSRGSVIPTFERQIERGGPVTVTHPDMTRYFMTIPEAVELVIQAGASARGGEVFVLDMGEPVKIDDLARDLIRLCGYVPGRDIEIVYTGLRPGEKLFEELFSSREEMLATRHDRIFVSCKETKDEYLGINQNIEKWARDKFYDKESIINLLADLIPEYRKPGYIETPSAKVLQMKVVR